MLKGVLEGCVLEIIGREETYGYQITRQLNELGFADVVEGTVYTILVRLEKRRLVETVRKPSELGAATQVLRPERRRPRRAARVLGQMGVRLVRSLDEAEGRWRMNFWERITGTDMTKEMKILRGASRKAASRIPISLERDYHAPLELTADSTGRNLMPILGGALELLQEAAA